ncbi:hypothetical protein SLEP1_g26237 [Rubroshorea leprosula]|uniref:Uncharacterized protein n=1 Tax=Rubroshorea leprosula TaxID=152421 RepID=A0AAV5JX27_9ROSI|nr:hypothetical protein SLEP1_g26237 [Rubroshorea leprosula]
MWQISLGSLQTQHWVCTGFAWFRDGKPALGFAWVRDANLMPGFVWVRDANPAPRFAKQTQDLG